MARTNYVFGTHALGYGIKHFCSKCKCEITEQNAIEVEDALDSYLGFGICSEESDDEGYTWRTFCRDCFAEVRNMSEIDVYNTYPAGEWSDQEVEEPLIPTFRG